MTQQGISTTIVEIDPAVHRFAVEFFNLTSPFPTVDAVESKMSYFVSPEIPQTHYMDAREYVHRRASIISGMRPIRETDRYDYVVHDVFSGGTVPTHLFTMEFWEDVKVVMKLDGILAVVRLLGSQANPNALTSFGLIRTSPGRSTRTRHEQF